MKIISIPITCLLWARLFSLSCRKIGLHGLRAFDETATILLHLE
jgi:hypothetical protein